jgi:hypothetical protein
MEQAHGDFSTSANLDTIHLRADVRRREQMLRIEMMNIKQPWATEAMKTAEDQTRNLVIAESKGEVKVSVGKTREEMMREADAMQQKAEDVRDLFPELAAYQLTRVAKWRWAAGGAIDAELEAAKRAVAQTENNTNTAAANLLSDAILLGLQKKITERVDMPTPAQVVKSALGNKKMLADYALVLPEKDRPEFLALIPDEQRNEVSAILNESVSEVLHHSVIDKGTEEDRQRKDVRLRVYDELKQVLGDSKKSDRKVAAALARAMGKLGGDVRLLLLELAREEIDADNLGKEKEQEYLPHILGVLVNKFDDYRVNDLALQMVGDARLTNPVRYMLLRKLVQRGYVSKDLDEW